MTSSGPMLDARRLPRLVGIAALVGLSVAWVIWTIGGFTLSDAEAYRSAAERLLHGTDLYPAAADPNAPEVYRYAPWFAAAWVPLALLPHAVGNAIWSVILLIAAIVAVRSLLRSPSSWMRLIGLLGFTILLWTAARGNAHPLVIAALTLGIDRRSGPLWLALAASLKAVPIIFVLVYVARRQWSRVALTLAVAAFLVAPMPLMGWSLADVHAGASISVLDLVSPAAWAIVAGLAIAAAAAVALYRPRWARAAAAGAVILALPRLLPYDATFLLPAFPPRETPPWSAP